MNPITRNFVETTCQAFNVNGYLLIKDALSAEEVCHVNEALDRLDLPEKDVLWALADKDDVFLNLVDHPSTFPYALALMGGNVQMLDTAVNIIPPNTEGAGWHEDGPWPLPYPSVDGKRPLLHLKFAFFLNDLTEDDRGNLAVVPGSHHIPFPRDADRSALWEFPGVIPLKVRAGTALVFHNGLWHASTFNQTDKPRRVVYCTYCHSWHRGFNYITPPQSLLDRLEQLPLERRQLLRQLLGAIPQAGPRGRGLGDLSGAGYYFANPEDYPAIKLIEHG